MSRGRDYIRQGKETVVSFQVFQFQRAAWETNGEIISKKMIPGFQ